MYTVKHDGKATKDDYDKIGTLDNHYTVVFNPNKETGMNQGEFNIYVYPIVTGDMEQSGMSFTYLMNYYIGSHHIPLMDDQPTLGFTSDEKINYYSYAFRSEVDEIKLSVTKVTGNVELLVSLNQALSFPTWNEVLESEGVFKTAADKNTISKTKIESFCSHDDLGY